jgi:hypothetical protein
MTESSPVETATRNSAGDEGGPFGFGDQVADRRVYNNALLVCLSGHIDLRRGRGWTRSRASEFEYRPSTYIVDKLHTSNIASGAFRTVSRVVLLRSVPCSQRP